MNEPNLILPNRVVSNAIANKKRLYFLAGPIRGAIDWQQYAYIFFSGLYSGCYVVCARLSDDSRYFYQFAMAGESGRPYVSQTHWERHYMELASHMGSIIFWLLLEDSVNPRKREEGPYAQDTYGELGRWGVRSGKKIGYLNSAMQEPIVNIVVGAEPEFPGLNVIRKNLSLDHGYDFPIYETLEETIYQAVSKSIKTNSR